MILDVQTFDIMGVKLFKFQSYEDSRGAFSEVFLSNLEHSEFLMNYIQENESISKYGVFRGMHFQKGEYSQSKLLRVVKGKVLDVFCDLRKSSLTFKKITTINLIPGNILYLPKGVAHGFLSLENDTILNYKCDNYYKHTEESGFNLFRSSINFDDIIPAEDIIISEKDRDLPSLENSYIFEHL